MPNTCCETARYLAKSVGTMTRSGQSRTARDIGMAERTPKVRASYEAAQTTARLSGRPPTATGRPRKLGAVPLLDRRVERVHVDVQDPAHVCGAGEHRAKEG